VATAQAPAPVVAAAPAAPVAEVAEAAPVAEVAPAEETTAVADADVASEEGEVVEPEVVKDPWEGLSKKPVIPIKDSVTKDFVICLFDGVKRKMLSRHITNKYSMTPQQYREWFNLPEDYPMTAPAYSAEKRMVAKSQGLGSYRKKKKVTKKRTRKSSAA
jgi:predicted transcriptional regulator